MMVPRRCSRQLATGIELGDDDFVDAIEDRCPVVVHVPRWGTSASISGAPSSQTRKAVTALRDELPRRVALWIGGAGAPKPSKGVERFDSLETLDAGLVAWSER